jgi:hypothetical protein
MAWEMDPVAEWVSFDGSLFNGEARDFSASACQPRNKYNLSNNFPEDLSNDTLFSVISISIDSTFKTFNIRVNKHFQNFASQTKRLSHFCVLVCRFWFRLHQEQSSWTILLIIPKSTNSINPKSFTVDF